MSLATSVAKPEPNSAVSSDSSSWNLRSCLTCSALNTIVYGTGRIQRHHMLRAGVLLGVLMAGLVTVATLALTRTL